MSAVASLVTLAFVMMYSCRVDAVVDCERLLAAHLKFEPYAPCPSDQPWQDSLFERCAPFPKRNCFTAPLPEFFSSPNNGSVRLAPPGWSLGLPKGRWATFDALAARTTGDCYTCFDFVHDRERWIWWVANFERVAGEKLSADGRFRTVLDLGAGAGGLAALLAERGIQVLAVAREWYDLPYFEAAAVRGVIMLMLDFRQRLPLSRSAVDLIVHEYSMKFLQTAEELELHLFELDRVLRCGGLVVQRGWGLIAATQTVLTNSGIDVVAEFLSRAALLKRVMEQLRWQILDFEIHQPTRTLHFISRKQCS